MSFQHSVLTSPWGSLANEMQDEHILAKLFSGDLITLEGKYCIIFHVSAIITLKLIYGNAVPWQTEMEKELKLELLRNWCPMLRIQLRMEHAFSSSLTSINCTKVDLKGLGKTSQSIRPAARPGSLRTWQTWIYKNRQMVRTSFWYFQRACQRCLKVPSLYPTMNQKLSNLQRLHWCDI